MNPPSLCELRRTSRHTKSRLNPTLNSHRSTFNFFVP